MNHHYRFPGMPRFVAREGVSPSFAAKIPGQFFVARAADALAQVCEARPEHRAAIFAEAEAARHALAAALATVDAAMAEVRRECLVDGVSRVEVKGAAVVEPLLASEANGGIAPADETKPKKAK